jgi:hypothetical protein
MVSNYMVNDSSRAGGQLPSHDITAQNLPGVLVALSTVIIYIGLSLAGHFQFFLYRFFARPGEKTIQNKDKNHAAAG